MPSVSAARTRTTMPPGGATRHGLFAQLDAARRDQHGHARCVRAHAARRTHASIAARIGSGNGRLFFVTRVDAGDDQANCRARLAGALVEEHRLPAQARRADVLEVRAHAQPVVHQRRRVVFRLARGPAAARSRTRSKTLSYGKPSSAKELHLGAFDESPVRGEIHDAGDVHVGPLHSAAALRKRARSGGQRVAKLRHPLTLRGVRVARQRIDFEVHAAADRTRSQRRARERLGNQRDLEPAVAGAATVRLTPSMATNAFARDQRDRERRRPFDADALALAFRRASSTRAGGVDVSVHEVAAHAVADAQRVLHVDRSRRSRGRPACCARAFRERRRRRARSPSTAVTVRQTPSIAIESFGSGRFPFDAFAAHAQRRAAAGQRIDRRHARRDTPRGR